MSFVMVLILLHHGTSLLFNQEQRPSDTSQWFFPTPKKITKKTKKLKIFFEASQTFEQSDNQISFDYYYISQFKKLRLIKTFLHLNISLILAHTDDLRIFLNLVNHKFDIIYI